MDSKDAFKDYPSLRPRPVKYSIHMYYLNFLKIFLSSTTAELFVVSLGIPNPKVQLYNAARATTTGGESAVTTNIWNPVRGILRGEGIRSVYGGISFMLMRHLLFNAPRVHFYDKIRQRITQPDPKEFKFLPSLLAGVAAGGTAKVLVSPLENIQERMQMDVRRGLPIRAMRSINHIYERYGVQGLWKGMGPGALHAMLLTAGDTACYDLSKQQFMLRLGTDDSRSIHFMASLVSGLAASILSTPADMVKTMYINQPKYRTGRNMLYSTTLDCVYKLITKEGFLQATYRNFLPTWLRLGPLNVFFWLSYEELLLLQRPEGF